MAMKTTLNIDDRLLRRAKKTAAERGETLTFVLEEALRAYLAGRPAPRKGRFTWVVIDDAELPPVDVADRSALYDFLDRDG